MTLVCYNYYFPNLLMSNKFKKILSSEKKKKLYKSTLTLNSAVQFHYTCRQIR